ncbi:MAG: dTDP-4-dehydrorhamnose reductase [Sedimentibacter sp.]
MEKILITGCNGQLGLELQNKLKDKYELILTNRSNLDVTKIIETVEFIRGKRPSVIINCAAYTAVDLCEEHEDDAYKSNAIGPKNLAIAAKEVNAKLVHISTDYVFDGDGIKDDNNILRPYDESDKTNPQSAYGRTKLQGEKFVAENMNKYFIIRTAWLYGEGKNFVRTMINLSRTNSEVKVVNDQIGSPTSTIELANMIEKLIETEEYGTYHGTCEGYCSWYDLTLEIYKLLNIQTKVIPVTTEEFPRPAKRPKYSVLENKKLNELSIYRFKSWQEALKNYLDEEFMNQ